MTESLDERQRLMQAILLNRTRRATRTRDADDDAIVARPRDAELPLSLAQRRLWFLCQLDATASAAYHMPVSLRLEGELDVAVLRTALDALVARHESLRTRFLARDGEPEQVIDPADRGFALRELDVSLLPADERAEAVAAHAREAAAAPFDLAAGPLVRGRLLRLDAHTHVLLLTQHHIISDGWSVGVLVGELGVLYRAFAEGAANPLPALALQYADYAAWQHSQLAGEAWQRQIDHWKQTLSGAPSLLELPTDRPRPPVQSYRGASLPLRLEPELVQALRSWSSRHGATLFMALTAGWAALLSRLGGQEEVVIGTPVANRPRAELEGLAGFFVNTLALRVPVDGMADAATLLMQVKAQALDAFAHQQLPFDQVVEHVRPERSLGHSPVFQTMLALNNTPGARELSLPGVRLQPQPQPRTTTQFDLSLALNEHAGALTGELEYATDLFDAATIQRWAGYLQRLLQALPDAEGQPVAALPMLSEREREQLVHGFNATARAYPAQSTIAEVFAACAARRGEAIALCDADHALSYAELDARANRLAHGLRAHGVDREQRVALIATRSLDLVVALLGVLKAGAAYVPLDPEQPIGRLADLVADSGATVVLSDRALEGAGFQATLPLAPSAWARYPDTAPVVAGQASDLAYVMYTSGSTGTPKGVMVEQGAVLRLAVNGGFAPLGDHDVVAHCANPAFDASTWELWAPLLNGARVAVIDPATVLEPAALSAALARFEVSAMWLTVGLFNAYVDALEVAFGQLDQLLIGGDALDVHTVGRLLSRSQRPRRLINGYGPTETTTFATTHEIVLADLAGHAIPIGRPIGNTTIRIVDGQGRAVPVGVIGELYIGGAGVARGYLNQPELSAARFVADPLGGPGRYYRSGDLGRWRADGTIVFAGRNDGQVKLRGFRIELGEIEAALQRLPGVREAVVAVGQTEQGGRRLVGYVVGGQGRVSDWRQTLSTQLPDYMVPSALVSLEALPLTANGKLDRRALPEPDAASLAVGDYQAPRNETERTLASIWRAILQVERVGIHDNFFELGGHSLLAARLASRVAAQLQRQVPVSAVFSHPSIVRMAGYLQQADAEDTAPIAVVDRSRPLPPSLAQRRLWFLSQLDGAAGVAYHMPVSLRLEGELDVAVLRAALDALVARHESLRTRFLARDGEPEQVIDPADRGFALRELDVSLLPADERAEAVAAHAREAATAPFDLAAGPLVRGRLLRLDAHTHVLLLTQHHIISDGWSVGVLVGELGVLYRAFAEGAANPLPALALQYADYAAWQHSQLAGEAWQRQIDHWKQTLSGAPSLLELPTDRPRPPVQSYRGASLPLRLEPELVQALRSWSSRHGATLFMALTAGWAALLSRLGGQEEVVIGTPVANRPRAELEGLAGFFVNTLALRVPVDGMADAATLLMQVKAQALDAFAHQQLPFDQVVEHVRPERSLGHSPVFQTMLALNNTPGARELSLPGVRLQPQPQPRTTTQFDLSLALNEHAGVLTGELEYATDLFDAATIQRWAGYLQRLLQAMATTEDCAVAQLPWLPEQELAQLQAWSLPDAAWSWPALTLPALFEAQVRRTPQAEALRFEGRSLSYAGLNRAANRVAHRLLALGVKPDDRVAIRAERGLELLIGLLGILKSGAGYVPIDPAYPQARQDYMLTDSAPAALLVDAIGVAGPAACPQLAIASDEPASEDNPQVPTLGPQHLAYVIYTSGSTGQPKGVMVEHASVAAFVRTHATSCRLQPGDRVLHFASCSFDTSIEEIFPALVSGATVVVRPSWMVSPDTHFVELLAVERIAILDLPTAFFHVWAQQAPQRRPALPEQVRLVVVGGEKLERGALAGWFAHPSARYATVLNTYGPTEATVYATSIALESVPQCESQVPIGRPLRGLKISILDSCGAPVPQGVIGEIHIGGVQVARGYLGQPTLTAERFVHDQDAAGDARLYRTGDLGCWLGDGNIAYAGRRDAQIKLRGFRIEPGEIEYALRRCDGVADALVLLHDDASGASRLVAYVVAAEANAPSEQMLHSALSEKLAAYMLPSCYVLLENFPLTRSGKIDRAALPVPNASARTNSEHELPVGAVESAIARVWAGLFGLEQVGRRDNFFELGGHSLLAITMIERLAGEGIELPVRDLFLSPVLADLAAQVSRGTTQPVPPNLIEPGRTAITPDLLPLVALSQASIDRIIDTVPGGVANVQDIYPLAPLQDGILFHHLLHAEDAADPYVLRVSLEFDGIVRMERFIDALKTVVARHDVLRTALFWQALERPVQVVLREVSLPVFDGVPGAVRMNLSAAPLLQLWRHADTGDDGLILTVLWHHIVSDAVAMGVILDEVHNLLLTDASALPPPAPYRDFIARTGAVHDSVHEAYFRERLGSVDETTAIGGIVDVRHDGAAIRQSVLRLEDDVVALIRRAATAGGTAPSVLFHAAWARVLSEHASRSDVVFGTVLTGRLQGMAQAGRTVGMFINTLPLRLDLAGRGVAEALDETRLRLAELLAHEHASLALAQRCSAVAAGIPLFTVLLNYRQHSSQTDADAVSSLGEGIRVGGAQARNNYPLTMSVDDDGTGFGLTSLSIGDIDGPALAGHLVRVVEALAAALLSDPQQRIDSLALIDAQEREQLLALGRGRSQARTRAHGLIDAFQAQAARSPQAIALRATESGASTDYATLAAHANRLAHALREQGLGPGDRVGICMERGLALPVALLAVLSSGAAYVPLDLRQGSERLARIIADANISVVLVENSSAPASLGGVDMLYLDGAGTDPDWLGEYPAQPLETGLADDAIAYVLYTSGSTGEPKGVEVFHAGLADYCAFARESYYDQALDGSLVASSHAFDLTVPSLYVPLLVGGCVELLPAGEELPALARRLEQADGAWLLRLTPSHVQGLLQLADASPRAGAHAFVIGGEAFPASLARALQAKYPQARLVNHYGPTETVVGCTWQRLDQAVLSGEGTLPIGRAMSNTRLYVLGPSGQLLPRGVPGELYIGGAGVARGYVNDAARTAERFLEDPFEAGGRMYRSGDRVRWRADGALEFLGRMDGQVKLRGYRIEPGEIEAVLREQVREISVGVHGEGATARLVAWVSGVSGEGWEEALRAVATSRLPTYMQPSVYVPLESLPLTANGKLDRKRLPAPERSRDATLHEQPQGACEQRIAAIWSELLKIEMIGRDDDFFVLGGHSLTAVQAVARLRAAFHREVPLRELFAHPSPRSLARYLDAADDADTAPIAVVDRSRPLPPSLAQRRLWFLSQLDGAAGVAYHMPVSLRLEGELDVAVLRAALDALVARHESLRTRFLARDGEPEQVIDPADRGFALRELDVSLLPADERAEAVATHAREAATAPFDLAAGPLVRGRLLRLDAHTHVLLLTQHHIISDGWSVGVLVGELGVLYRAFAEGAANPLPALALQYADYAAWQHSQLAGEVWQRQIDHWKQTLSGAPSLLELPTDRPRPPVQSYRGASLPLRLEPELVQALRSWSSRHGATLFMALTAGWAALLSRLGGQEEVVIGTPVANRPRAELEGLAGFFVNTLALRVPVDGMADAATLLMQVKAQALDAFAHQQLPFDQVVEHVRPERSLGHSPVFQTMLALNNTPGARELSLPGVRLQPQPQPRTTTQFDLSLALNEHAGALTGELEYATDLFDAATIQRWAGYLQRLLQAMATTEDCAVAQLPWLPEQELAQLQAWSLPDAAWSWPALTLPALFEAQVRRTPQAEALRFEGRSLSYAGLNRAANRVAHRLLALGVKPDDRVAIRAERGLELLIGLLGILKSGAGYVPIDPAYPQARQDYMLTDSAPAALLVDAIGVAGPAACPQLAIASDEPASEDNPQVPGLRPQHLAYVIYTSGSTGQPKGVMVEHASVVNLWQALETWLAPACPATARVTLNAGVSFDASLQGIVQWLSGRCVVVVPTAVRRDAEALRAFLRDERIDVCDTTPAQLEALLVHGLPDVKEGGPRTWLVGGEAIAPRLWRALAALDALALNVYGPTECTVDSSCARIESAVAPHIGRPLANVQVRVLDAFGAPVPVGVRGQIHIGGAALARGYWRRPELTAERFVELHGGRFYRSGDLGRWCDDGRLEYLGRADEQVKLRGHRVELGEIEAALAAVPGIEAAAVLLGRDAAGAARLVAYVASAENEAIGWHDHLAVRLPAHMLPSAYVRLDRLPLTANGKIDRRRLPDCGQETQVTRGHVEPSTDTERTLTDIWQQLLGVERVGVEDNFFELGGHSLLAMRMTSAVAARLGRTLPVRVVFEGATPAAVAAWLDAQDTESAALPPPEATSIEPAPRDGRLPMSYSQRRLWFIDRLQGSDAYRMSGSLRLRGRLDVERLHAALRAVVSRHEVLRTTYGEIDGEPVQRIADSDGLPFAIDDLRGMEPTIRDGRCLAIAAEEATHPFDLGRDHMLRGRLAVISDDEHLLWLTAHHIAFDGWSYAVLVRECMAIYAGAHLPPLRVQYADYATWQRQRLDGPALQTQLGYWRGQLEDLPPTHSLVLDAPRSVAAAGGSERYAVRLEVTTLQALHDLARRHDASLFMLLHTSLAAVLAGFGAGTDLAIGTPVAGRGHVALEPMIGFFVNTLVLRSDLSGDPDFETALARVRSTDLEAYGHAEVPFDMLVEELNPVRSLLHAPLFQIQFNMRNNERVHLHVPGLSITVQEQEAALAKFDLQIGAEECDDGLLLDWLAAPKLFSSERVRRMADAWVSLLAQIAADPSRKLSEYTLLDADERSELLTLGTGPDRAQGRGQPLPLAIAQVVRGCADAPAVRAGAATLSYAELGRLSNRLAHRLVAAGLGPGDRIGICMERGLALPVALLAVLSSGAAYVPLDLRQGSERLARIIADANISVVLVESSSAPASLGGVDMLYLDGAGTDPDWLGEYPAQPLETRLADDAIAYVLYTSGSTGEPKGVEVFHAGLADYCAFARESYYDQALDGSLVASSHAFDLTVPSLYVPLLVGGCVELLPAGEELPALARRLEQADGAWLLRLTPSHVQGLLQLADASPRAGAHAFVIGGEAFPASLARALQAKYPQARLVNHYGPTETVVGCTWQRLDQAVLSGEGTLPIGRAMSNTRLYVLGPSGQLLPRGVPGELYIGGAGVARGYVNDAARTAERFLEDPFEAGGRMYRSGDRVRWRADGALEFLGRMDGQVKLRGYRIEPGEIEAVLREQVREISVGVHGEGATARLVAWVSGVSGEGWEEALRAVATSRLPTYMQPSVYVPLESLPLTANGKLDRKRLPAPSVAELPWSAPEGEIECLLERIWAQALDLERVSATADFFALGGHSLLAMRVINDVQREFGIELPLRRLFENPDIRSLARLVSDQRIRSENLSGAVTDATHIEMEW